MKNIIEKPFVGASFKFKLILLTIFLYPLILIFQGGDLTDTGYLATKYFFFWEEIQNNSSPIFFTEFIGAVWMKLFPSFGILGLRILYLIFLWGSIYINYNLLKDYTNKKNLLLFSFLVSEICLLRNMSIVFDYDIASWLFISSSTFILTKGIRNKNFLLIFLAGFILVFAAACCFSSVVCLPFYVFVLVVCRVHLKSLLLFLFGFILCCVSFYFILQTFGGVKSLLNNIGELSGNNLKTLESIDYRGYTKLLSTYLNSIYAFLPYLLFCNFSLFLLSFTYSETKNKIYSFSLVIILFVVSWYNINNFAFRVWNPFYTFSYLSPLKYIIPSLCFLPLVYGFIYQKNMRFIILLAIFGSIGQVVGTNTGLFFKLAFGLTILIPLSVIIIDNVDKKNLHFFTFRSKPVNRFLLLFIMFFCTLSTLGYVFHVDYGLELRLKCIHHTSPKKMYGIFTTKNNKERVDLIYNSISKNISKNNAVFIYGHEPLFYYLNCLKPAINDFWISKNSRDSKLLFKELKKMKPTIIDTKKKILGKEGEKNLRVFLKENNYKIFEENKLISIWKSTN